MVYHSALYLKHYFHAFNVVHYLSFRMIASLLTSLFLFFVLGSWFIKKSRRWFSSAAREYTPEAHRAKDGMPTMGGLLIIGVVCIASLLWCNLIQPQVWIFLLGFCAFGAIGFWDDLSKIRYRKGISERRKFFLQCLAAGTIVTLWLYFCEPPRELWFPFFKSFHPNLGLLIIPWALFIIVGASNAVNLTDGLDGLAISSLIPNIATFTGLLYLSSHLVFANYLQIPFMAHGEIAVIGTALIGASLGFLWYNCYPAQIFMGDVGSLSLGAALAMMALMANQVLLLPLTGALFVIETLSVIIQVISYKTTGKRFFKMAPLHHHFELLGWPESKITVRFGILTLVCCLFALMTLKIR